MTEKQKQIGVSILKYTGAIVIFLCVVWNIRELNIIHVLNDEYGYWASAAFFSGKDWSAVTANSNYYSYGYGLLLSIIMRLFQRPEMMIKGAVVLNGIFLVIAYFLTSYCAKKLFPNIKAPWIWITSLVVTLYSNNIVQSQMSWPENLLYLLFWISITLIITLYEKATVWKSVALALCDVYLYMVHQRSIAVVAACGILIIVMFLLRDIKLKHVLYFIGAFIILLLIHSFIKNLVIDALFQNSDIIATNDYSGQYGKIIDIFTTPDGFLRAVTGLIGKLFYLGAATLGIAGLGFYYTVRKCVADCRAKAEKKKLYFLIALFVLLSTVFALGINTIFMVNGERLDCVIYGRYTEYIIGPLLMYGFLNLFTMRFYLRELIVTFTAVLVCGGITAIRMYFMATTEFNIITNIGVSLFYRDGQNGARSTFGLIFFLIIIFALLVGIVWAGKRWKKGLTRVVLVICAAFWIITSIPMLKLITETHGSLYTISSMVDIIREYGPEDIIDYVTDKNAWDSREIEYIRFLLPDAIINYETVDNIDEKQAGEGWIILNTDNIFAVSERLCVVSQWRNLQLAVPKDSEIAERLSVADYPIQSMEGCYYLLNGSGVASQVRNEMDNNTWVSDGNEGFLLYGPFVTLDEGAYCLNAKLSAKDFDGTQQINCTLDVSSDGEILLQKEVKFVPGEPIKIELPFVLSEKRDNMEFRIYVYGGNVVEIDEIYLIKL